MNSLVLPTFRRSGFRRPPRSLQAPWGPGMPGTHYVLRGDEYDVRIQDASEATTGRRSILSDQRRQRRKKQKGGIYPGVGVNRPPPSRIAQMQRAIRTHHPTNPRRQSRRQRAASRALANTRSQKLARGVNRAMWKVRHKLTPTTLTGKLGGAAALGGILTAAPIAALLGTVLSKAVRKDK